MIAGIIVPQPDPYLSIRILTINMRNRNNPVERDTTKAPKNGVESRILRAVLLAVGLTSTGLAVLGIFLPLLPTVPLLLLAAACFARSNQRFHRWLLEHRRLGPLINGYLSGLGVPRRTKISAIVLIWLTITPSAFFIVGLVWVRVLLMVIALAVTIYLLRLPSAD
jgi:uncharacterized protein